jgi:hypothetical protein
MLSSPFELVRYAGNTGAVNGIGHSKAQMARLSGAGC